MTTAARPHLAALGLLAVLAVVWFWPVVKGDELTQSFTLYDATPWTASRPAQPLPRRAIAPDAAVGFQPQTLVARRQLADGHLPLWNPHEYAGGIPLAGNFQTALFFPLTWPLLVLPFHFAWGLVAILKLLLAGFGAYLLARELRAGWGGGLVAGAVYMLSAPLVVWVQWPLGTVFAMFPWVLWASTRVVRRPGPGEVAALGLAAGGLILAGHPESALIGVSAAAIYVVALLARHPARARAAATWVGGLVLGAALAAIAILPFAQVYGESVTKEASASSAIHLAPALGLDYALPALFGAGAPSTYGVVFVNSIALYFGLPALLLALVALARNRRVPAAIGLAAMALVALAAGFHVAPVSWWVEHVPPWAHAVFSERIGFVVALAGAVGAGIAYSSLSRRPLPGRRAAATVAAAGVVMAVALLVARHENALATPGPVQRHAVLLAVLALVATAVLLGGLGRMPRRAGLAATLLVVAISVVAFREVNVLLAPDRAYPPEPASLRALAARPGPFRVGVVRDRGAPDVLPPNTASLYGLDSVEGYDFPLSERWSSFQQRVLGESSLRPEVARATGPPSPAALTALRMMNTRYYVAAAGDAPPARGMRRTYGGRDATVFEDPRALPRAWTVGTTRTASDGAALSALARGALAPRREALVPPGSFAVAPGTFAPARVDVVAPDRVRVTLPPRHAGWLVLSQAYSSAWRATVDGRDVEVKPTDYVAMGVPVPASARTVEFFLDRTPFWIGVVISVLALVLTGILLALGRRRAS